MFGLTTNQLTDSGAQPPTDGTLPEGDNGLGVMSGQAVQSTYTASVFAHSAFGLNNLMESQQQDRADAYQKATGQPLKDTYAFGDLPDAVEADQHGLEPVNPSWQARLYHGGVGTDYANAALQSQIETEKKVAQYNADNPDAPLPTARDMWSRTQQQAQDMNAQADDDAARTRGVTLPLVGKVTAPGLVGGMLGMANANNPDQVALLVAGGPATKALAGSLTAAGAITSEVAARVASGFALNAGVTYAGQMALAGPSQQSFGLPFDSKAAAFQSLAAGIFGGVAEGAAEHFFPGATKEAAANVGDNLREVAEKDTKTGQLAQDIIAAKTPDEAAAIMADAPLAVKSSLIDRIEDDPTSGVRGGQQAMERENVVKQMQPEEMPWADHVQRAMEVQDAIEKDQPMPGHQPVASTHIDDALNELRQTQQADAVAVDKKPPTLLQFLAERGGVYDEGGELQAMNADLWHKGQRTADRTKFQSRLIRPADDINGASLPGMATTGLSKYSLDSAANAAWEHGYFPESPHERPTINDLLDKIDEGIRGKDHYPQGLDHGPSDHQIHLDNLSAELDKAGIDLNIHTNEEAWAALNKSADNFHAFEEARRNGNFSDHIGESDDMEIGRREQAEIESDLEAMRQAAEASSTDGGIVQDSRFDGLKPDDIIPLGDMTVGPDGKISGGLTFREAFESIRDDKDVVKALQSCLL